MNNLKRVIEARDTEVEAFCFKLTGEDTCTWRKRPGGREQRKVESWEQMPLGPTLPDVLSLLMAGGPWNGH